MPPVGFLFLLGYGHRFGQRHSWIEKQPVSLKDGLTQGEVGSKEFYGLL